MHGMLIENILMHLHRLYTHMIACVCMHVHVCVCVFYTWDANPRPTA